MVCPPNGVFRRVVFNGVAMAFFEVRLQTPNVNTSFVNLLFNFNLTK